MSCLVGAIQRSLEVGEETLELDVGVALLERMELWALALRERLFIAGDWEHLLL